MKQLLTLSVLFCWCLTAYTNTPFSLKETLVWDSAPIQFVPYEGAPAETIWSFEGASYGLEASPSLPFYYHYFPVNGPGLINIELVNVVYESIDLNGNIDKERVPEALKFETQISANRGKYRGYLSFIPIIRTGNNSYQKVVSFELKIDHIPSGPSPNNRGNNTYTSKLSNGTIYKIAVNQTGIHKIDANFLSDQLGIDLNSLDPKKIQLLGNGGGMLPLAVGQLRSDDLIENAILIQGESDGRFDAGDYILFYGEGPSTWYYDADKNTFQLPINVYDENNYYYLKIGNENGLRIGQQPSASGSAYTTNTFNDFIRYETDQYNLLYEYDLAQGSGTSWVGDYFKNQTTYSYPSYFTFPNLVTESAVIMEGNFLSRSEASGNYFSLNVAGQNFATTAFSNNDTGNPNATFAYNKDLVNVFLTNSATIPVTITFNKTNPVDEGWMDYLQMNARRRLIMVGDQMSFRDIETLAFPVSTFELNTGGNALTIWDITDPLQPVRQNANISGSTLSFAANTLNLREFVAFKENAAFLTPTAVGAVENQNIHGIDDVDMVIIYHPEFLEQAQRLADHRSSQNGLEIALVNIHHIWNEFASGKHDVTAIRDFAEMVYSRTNRFKYLLLFGDGSFDHRNIEELGKNFIPTYETPESYNPINSFPSDDFFGLLDEGEGSITNNDQLDISVGRVPVNDVQQANTVVDKIINYETNSSTLGDWRNRMLFVADDGDGNDHTEDADDVAELIAAKYPNLNIDKIYLDAYNQVPTPGGERVPGATDALNQNMFKGLLAVAYLGHGGSKGWSQERVLQIPDINSWTNFNSLPIFITATCSFAGFDDPGFTTAGEEILLNRRGGSVALYSTTRAVYASLNKELTLAVADTLFYQPNGELRTLGDVLRIAKNNSGGSANSRKFALLGDPSMKLALPKYEIVTTKINGVDVSQGQVDTIRALQKVTIEGEVRDKSGNLLEDFNGILAPTLFDKRVSLSTLGQGSDSPVFTYGIQKNVIFKGRASVTNGQFSFTFVVPKDINFAFGPGKISYYADNQSNTDASGSSSAVVIGGTDENALADEQGPEVEVYMNTVDFVYGGLTGPSPTLLVLLEDDNGINIVGNSIGHDLTGVLDELSQNTFLLNDFYEAELDDYTKGKVRFPLADLEEGTHSIRVRAWDVANNSSEGFTEFVVAGSGEIALDHVLNYPNPFIDATCFQFEHNMENQEIDVMIQIYTVAGRLIKTINERINPLGSRLSQGDCIQWDGTDDYGDPLARGVYVYKVRIRAASEGLQGLQGESDFEKLVILR